MTTEEAIRQLEARREFVQERMARANEMLKAEHIGRHEIDFLRGQMAMLHTLIASLNQTGALGQ